MFCDRQIGKEIIHRVGKDVSLLGNDNTDRYSFESFFGWG